MAERMNVGPEQSNSKGGKGGKGAVRKVINYITGTADDSDEIRKLLNSYSDTELGVMTQFYRQRLEEAILELVESIALALIATGSLSNDEYGFISKLSKQQRRKEAARYLLDIVAQKNGQTNREFLETLVKMQGTKPKLKRILKEIKKKGSLVLSNARTSQLEQTLSANLKCIQKEHKAHLLAKTENVRKCTIRGKDTPTADRYTELIIISSLRERRLVEHELLSRGKDHEEWQQKYIASDLEKIRIEQLFRSSFGHNSLCGTSVVSGVAGIGKTTMVQRIVHEWAAGKIYPQFHFVFHFTFRNLNAIKGRRSLDELVLDIYPYLENTITDIWMRPEHLLLVFDGLDEFQHTIDFTGRAASGNICSRPDCRCEVSEIVRCLVQQQLLKGCSVLVTSRPTALGSLEKANINLWAEILGFLADERKNYFRVFFGNEELANKVFKYVEENEILYTMCYNPAYCWIMCSTLGPLFTQPGGKQSLPKTVTQLFSNYVYNLLKNHRRDVADQRMVLLRLGELAYQGVSKRVIVFNEDHFGQHQLEPSRFTSGFMMEILEKDDAAKNVVYTFLHLTIQEFLAALAHYLSPKHKNMFELLPCAFKKDDGRFEIFIRFVVGLSASTSSRQLEEILGPLSHHTTCQVIDWLQLNVQAEIKNMDRNAGKRQLLNIFHYLAESQNRALVRKTVGSVERLTFGDSNPQNALRLNPLDCAVLSHVLQLCETMEELNLEKCYIQTEGVKRLAPAVHKCKVLRLNHNHIGDTGVKLLSVSLLREDCKTQKLDLQDNNLTAACIEDLRSAFSVNQSLTMLYLDGNTFTDHCVPRLRHLIMSCKNLELIQLWRNQFSSDGQKQLRSLRESRAGLRVFV
ncbi:NACHT, LRR and PYD domains-containing protein 3-like [Scyliorhinus canicula]|uniref:NACHT, LRR and PYD domains-containing protein 3-like n=1 Tax=Scyliorhinus canicula TaxID=7830 RepID=UPI0018F29E02|nr:NACHT, LRR and PYD domains-containing protein 3-like [Scyliorhinus canicula]